MINPFSARILRPQSIKRLARFSIIERCHSTNMMVGTVSGDNGRLRLGEEKYCNDHSTPFQQPYIRVLESLAQKTENEYTKANMMVSELQSKFLYQMVKILRPDNVLELGGFTGYSAIAMGAALSPKAKLTSLELEHKNAVIAREFIQLAQLQDKVEIIVGPASESIVTLVKELPALKYDFIFLDADKGGYINYYELIMKHNLLSDRGIIVTDNVLFFGQVHQHAGYAKGETHIEASKNLKKQAEKVHLFNEHVAKDPRSEVVMLPIFDGLTIIRKKDL